MLPCLDTAKPRHAAVGAHAQGCGADAAPASQGLRRAQAGLPPQGGASVTNTADVVANAGVWVAGSDAPEKTALRIGFMSLTDCASVVMASALGIDRKYGLRITPVREASWASIRDKVVQGELDAVHALYGLVYGAQLGIGSARQNMAILMGLNRNGQAITLSAKLAAQGVRDGAGLRALMTREPQETRGYAFAQTFPTGTHAMWLYYWLAANGIDPLREAKVITVPPPQMVANMRAGNMDGFCVGEPWGAQAVAEGIGFTVATTQSIWRDHPEKVLATTADFATRYPNTARALIAALLETSRYIDASEANRRETAATIAGAGFVDADMSLILGRMLGHYDDGLGDTWEDPQAMKFHQDGAANFPFLSDGMWFMTQHKRWGLLKTHPDYLAVARAVHRVDLYREAAGTVGVAVPDGEFRSATLMDGVTWDARDPAAYADGFAIGA
jgi:nitrate/nitrite transport system substrate-binding protein